mgnify:CR=1 FL=1
MPLAVLAIRFATGSGGSSSSSQQETTAGVVGWNERQEFTDKTLAGQFAQTLLNILAILACDGADASRIVRLTCYVTSIDEYLEGAKEIGAIGNEPGSDDRAVGYVSQEEHPHDGEQQDAGDHQEAGVAEGELEANAQTRGSIHGLLPHVRCLVACRCGTRRRPRWRSATVRRAVCAGPRP